MVLLYKAFIFFLFLVNSLLATKWPLVIVPKKQGDILHSSSQKKYNLCSHQHFKREIIFRGVNDVFPAKVDPFADLTKKESVRDIFFDVRAQRCIKIRVLIAKAEQSVTRWTFTAPDGFKVQVADGAAKTTKIVRVPTLHIIIKHGFLLCNGKRIKGQLRIQPIKDHIICNGIMYDGSFIITHHQCGQTHKSHFLCVNELELEDYVRAVLRTESWPGWPLEVNKAFAIACRSYALFKIKEAQRCGRMYHIKNTNAHQTYRGKHDIAVLKAAVKETRGMVLGFRGAPILAMFDSCCGGIIPAHIEDNDFDFAKVPYLAREYPCHFCKQSSLYTWQISYDHAMFESLIKHHMPEVNRITAIRVTKRDKAGMVMEVSIKGGKQTVTISGKRLYSIVKDIKSFHFDVRQESDKIFCMGRGFGHHLGLCQWGARDMVRNGWDYKSILRFYYPGAYFMHLM